MYLFSFFFFLCLASRARLLPGGGETFFLYGKVGHSRGNCPVCIIRETKKGSQAELREREADLPEIMRRINNSRKVIGLLGCLAYFKLTFKPVFRLCVIDSLKLIYLSVFRVEVFGSL